MKKVTITARPCNVTETVIGPMARLPELWAKPQIFPLCRPGQGVDEISLGKYTI